MPDEQTDLRAIERRMDAVTAVRQVFQAVWALARAQLPLAEAAAQDATAYLDWVDRVVDRLAGAPVPRPAGPVLSVVLGPERAYCGALPRQVVAQVPAENILGLVGSRTIEQARTIPGVRARIAFALPGAAAHDEHEEVARAVAEAVLAHAAGAQVELLHPVHGSAGLHRTVLLAGERVLVTEPPETYSQLQVVLDAAMREAVTGRLAVGLAEVLRAEVRARVAAAEQARHAADDKLADLRQQWRTARQEQITSELLEVVAGRQASRDGGT